MNKLTAEKCREQFEEWGKSQRCELDKWVRGDKAGEYKNPVVAKLWQAWQASRQALEIALQVLEAEPVADVVAWNHSSEERKCSVQLRRFDLKPGPLFMLAPQTTTDTYQQIENDGWIEWKGGKQPVSNSTLVEVKLQRDGYQGEDNAMTWDWTWRDGVDPIIAYRVIENDGREG